MMNNTLFTNFKRFFSIRLLSVTHLERIVATIGGFIAILGVVSVSHLFVSGPAGAILVASMGASAILLFVVPHGP